MITTTLARIQAHKPSPCYWRELLAGLGKTEADDEPLPFARIVEISGLDDALWCCRVEPQYDREWRLFAVWCARPVQHLMTDPRSVAALDVAERYARGEATDAEMDAARTDARAARTAGALYSARAAVYAAGADAAVAACAGDAHVAAVEAGRAAVVAPWSAEGRGAAQVVMDSQTEQFLRIVNETESRT